MEPQRTKQISELFFAALECEPAERPAFLAQACAGDAELRREVELLLAADEQAANFLEEAPFEAAAAVLADDQAEAMLGRQIGPYRIKQELGHGGMGVVYLALDTRLERQIAIKLLPAEFTQDQDRVRRFIQEAKAASALNHPNIITIHEISQDSGTHYITTEFIDGQTLRRHVQSERLGLSSVLEVGIQTASALAAAHEAGIVHRDIKPENVMLRRDGIVKVLDFGLAKLTEPPAAVGSAAPTMMKVTTESGVVMGTANYMSPEQARGLKVDARSDIFSLGVVLYELAAGRRPFEGATMMDVLAALLEREPAPLSQHLPEAPAELQRIVARALHKAREERYQDIKELLHDLKQLKQELELEAKLARANQPAAQSRETAVKNNDQAVLETVQTGALSTDEASPTPTIPSLRLLLGGAKRHKLGVALTLVMLLAVVAAVAYFSFFNQPAVDSLAVLPFVNVGENPDTEYLSDGITDSLINRLSRLPGLKVMSRNAVFRYKGKETDAQQAGKSLGVRAVLTGKVILRGDDLIIRAELVDVRDNSHLWGDQYDHKLTDLLAVPTELARDLSQQLRLKLSDETQQRLAKPDTENPEAYEPYLKGRYALNTFWRDKQQSSLGYFQQALEKDPNFALAHAGLAEAYTMINDRGTTFKLPLQEAYALAKAAALKAIELDDALAEAHASLGVIAFKYDWDWAGAEREFKRAIALKPNFVPAQHYYSHYLISQGRFDESLDVSLRALALDPLDVTMNFHLGHHYLDARQLEPARIQLEKTVAMNPSQPNTRAILGLVYAQQGRYREAIAEVQKGLELGDKDVRGLLGYVYAISGQRAEAQKSLAQLLEEAKSKLVSGCDIARIYAVLGEKEQAFAWLEKAIAERDSNLTLPGLKVDMRVESLRSDPRFIDLLRRMSLAQ